MKTTYDGESTAKKYVFPGSGNKNRKWEYAGIKLVTPAGKKNVKYVSSVTQKVRGLASAAKTITLLPQGEIAGEIKLPRELTRKINRSRRRLIRRTKSIQTPNTTLTKRWNERAKKHHFAEKINGGADSDAENHLAISQRKR